MAEDIDAEIDTPAGSKSTALMIPMPDPEDLGPAMQSCTEKQRGFVVAWFMTGDVSKAAHAAGYALGTPGTSTLRANASKTFNNPRVQAAIKEHAQNVMPTMLPKALNALSEIMDDRGHKDRAKAVQMVLDRTGMHAKTETIHSKPAESRLDRIRKIVQMARDAKMPIDQLRKMLGGAMDFIDADYKVVEAEIRKNVEDDRPEAIDVEVIDSPEPIAHDMEGLEDIL